MARDVGGSGALELHGVEPGMMIIGGSTGGGVDDAGGVGTVMRIVSLLVQGVDVGG